MTDQNVPPPEQPPAPPPEPKKKKVKPRSRSQRWFDAAGDAQEAIQTILNACDELDNALDALKGVQEEYEEWKDNLPDNLANSPVGEKLQAVCDLDLDASSIRDATETIEGTVGEAAEMDLPQGFGRD